MTNDDRLWTAKPPSPQQSKPAERLWTITQGTPVISCELRFHGETYGWEVQLLHDGELFVARGAFMTRELALVWAERERREVSQGHEAT